MFKRSLSPSNFSSSQETLSARRIRKANEIRLKIQEAIGESSTKPRLSAKSIQSYDAIKKLYNSYISDVNFEREHNKQSPIVPFTKFSFNKGKLH